MKRSSLVSSRDSIGQTKMPKQDLSMLSASQAIAFSKVIQRKNLFLTGSAGTGKSLVISKIQEYCAHHNINCALTATTGIAALSIGGKTIHSFLWLRPEDNDSTGEQIVNRIRSSKYYGIYKRLLESLDILIIDEVSMMSPKLFEQISDVCKLVRCNSSSFGGLQVLLVGDFFQLGPVAYPMKFLFESPEFDTCATERVVLTDIFRQKDPEFSALLSRMRYAELTPEDVKILKSRVGADVSNFGIKATELWCTNKDVDKFNQEQLDLITGPLVSYLATFGVKVKKGTQSSEDLIKKFKTTIGPLDINLKGPNDVHKEEVDVGAQVMLTFNLDTERGMVNGSRGCIIGFKEASPGKCKHESFYDTFQDDYKAYIKGQQYPVVRFLVNSEPLDVLMPMVRTSRETKEHIVYAWHMPLKLAWATTIHKSQGLSLDCVKISLDHTVFADGQAYVACSRARTLQGLSLIAFDEKSIKANQKVKEFYMKITNS